MEYSKTQKDEGQHNGIEKILKRQNKNTTGESYIHLNKESRKLHIKPILICLFCLISIHHLYDQIWKQPASTMHVTDSSSSWEYVPLLNSFVKKCQLWKNHFLKSEWKFLSIEELGENISRQWSVVIKKNVKIHSRNFRTETEQTMRLSYCKGSQGTSTHNLSLRTMSAENTGLQDHTANYCLGPKGLLTQNIHF